MSNRHLLIVDDDEETLTLLKAFLSQEGYQISIARNSSELSQVLDRWSIDLLVLDVMLEGESGLDICKQLRLESSVPILMLTAMSADQDRINGLEIGADDYMIKPYNPDVLLARIKAILRRSGRSPSLQHRLQRGVYLFSGWTFDLVLRELTRSDGLFVSLSNGEANLLKAFLSAPKIILSRTELHEALHDSDSGETKKARTSIDIQVSRLRQKLEQGSIDQNLIRTVRGEGYMLASDVEKN